MLLIISYRLEAVTAMKIRLSSLTMYNIDLRMPSSTYLVRITLLRIVIIVFTSQECIVLSRMYNIINVDLLD